MSRWSALLLLLFLVVGCRPAPHVESPTPKPETLLPSPAVPVQVSSPTPTPTPEEETLEEQIARLERQNSSVEVSVATSRPTRPASRANLELVLPGPGKAAVVDDSQLASLQEQARYSGSAADWRLVAERAVALKDFATAHEAFASEAAIYREKGHKQAAIAEQTKADQYATDLEFYSRTSPPKSEKQSRLEPENGCLVGAFIDRDPNLGTHHFASQTHGDIEEFNELTGKRHASFFMYRSYGHPFPREWAEYVKSQGAVVHIAWEPKSVQAVYDEEYLKKFVDAAKALDHPVMLRFASEMNGEWTGYNGDPEAYKKAFRYVYQETRRAPKVALMWCPNTVPQANIQDYYPGDDAVDWVGVNFYSVPFLDNNPERPGEKIHPTDHLRYVYDVYSSRKPIAIGEWAASHRSALVEKDLTPFAKTKLGQLYAALPTRFPRVKMVNWYDCNNMVQAREERQLNNFQLTGSEKLLAAYAKAVSQPYFVGAELTASPIAYRKVSKTVKLSGGDEIRLFLKSYDPVLKVYFRDGGRVVHASDDPLEWYVKSSDLSGAGTLEVLVYDSQNRFVTRSSIEYTK